MVARYEDEVVTAAHGPSVPSPESKPGTKIVLLTSISTSWLSGTARGPPFYPPKPRFLKVGINMKRKQKGHRDKGTKISKQIFEGLLFFP
jgi:hypothetical protein